MYILKTVIIRPCLFQNLRRWYSGALANTNNDSDINYKKDKVDDSADDLQQHPIKQNDIIDPQTQKKLGLLFPFVSKPMQQALDNMNNRQD